MVIIDLAVADGYYTAFRICYRLAELLGNTTNGQAGHAKDGRLRVQLASGVRPAVSQGSEHCLDANMSDFATRYLEKGYIAADATHSRTFSELTIGNSQTARQGFEPIA